MLNESAEFKVNILIFHDDIIYLADGEIGRGQKYVIIRLCQIHIDY